MKKLYDLNSDRYLNGDFRTSDHDYDISNEKIAFTQIKRMTKKKSEKQ